MTIDKIGWKKIAFLQEKNRAGFHKGTVKLYKNFPTSHKARANDEHKSILKLAFAWNTQ